MRVLLDYRPALRQRTGVGEYAHQLASAVVPRLAAAGEVVVFSSSWKDRLPAKFQDRAPRLWWDDEGFSHLEAEGRLLDIPGLNTMLVEGREGMQDVESRIRDLDAEGVDKDVIFPQRTLSLVSLQDLELRGACMRAYNEWLSEYCKSKPERLYGVGILNWWEPEAARDNLQELKGLGFKAMEIPSMLPGVGCWQARRASAGNHSRSADSTFRPGSHQT